MLREIAAALKARPAATLLFAAVFAALGVVLGALVEWNKTDAKPALSCAGEYADSFQEQSARGRELEEGPGSVFTYLVRNTARYECPFYGSDGKIHRKRLEAKEHGTAFAYEVIAGETYLLTNEHVAVWPEVTDSRNHVEGVGDGCKRVDEKLRIVHDERDEYEPGHIVLSRVAFDPRLDAAVLKTSTVLPVLPYKIGKTASLRQGNAVQVRGFPLGLLHAVNTGKVVNPYDLDLEQGWDHVDFVVDALLAEGNSGSPVLALSCRTGQFELVGMYHAGYKEASALNVVIGIDQLREFMTKKKRIPRASSEGPTLSTVERRRLEDGLGSGTLPLFDFGGLPVIAERSEAALRYHLYGRSFPVDDRRIAVLEDRPAAGKFGELGRLLVRGEGGWRESATSALGEDERDLMARIGDGLRMHMLRVLEYRRVLANPKVTAEERRRGRELLKALERQSMPERELIGNFMDLVERLAPGKDTPVATGSVDAGVPAAPTIRPTAMP